MEKIPVGKIMAPINIIAAIAGTDRITKKIRKTLRKDSIGCIFLESVVTAGIMVPATLLSVRAWSDEELNLDVDALDEQFGNLKAALTYRKDVKNILRAIDARESSREDILAMIETATERVPEATRKLIDSDGIRESLLDLLEKTYGSEDAEGDEEADSKEESGDEGSKKERHNKIIAGYTAINTLNRVRFFSIVNDLTGDARSGNITVEEARKIFRMLEERVDHFMDGEADEAERRFERDMMDLENAEG